MSNASPVMPSQTMPKIPNTDERLTKHCGRTAKPDVRYNYIRTVA